MKIRSEEVDMMAIRKLLMQHEKINRRGKNLENGVKTWTTSEHFIIKPVLGLSNC